MDRIFLHELQEIKKSTHEIQSLHPEVYRTLLFHVRFKSSIVLGTMQWIRRATLKTVERSTWLVELGLQWFVFDANCRAINT